MNTEESARVKTSGCRDRGHGDDERGVKPARDRWSSVEILRDLGLSKEKIVAYHRRFPTPTLTSCAPPSAPPAALTAAPATGIRASRSACPRGALATVSGSSSKCGGACLGGSVDPSQLCP
jgi:hypothetical protein